VDEGVSGGDNNELDNTLSSVTNDAGEDLVGNAVGVESMADLPMPKMLLRGRQQQQQQQQPLEQELEERRADNSLGPSEEPMVSPLTQELNDSTQGANEQGPTESDESIEAASSEESSANNHAVPASTSSPMQPGTEMPDISVAVPPHNVVPIPNLAAASNEEDPADDAVAYVQKRIKTEQQENIALRQVVAQLTSRDKRMTQELSTLKIEAPALRAHLQELVASKSNEDKELAEELQRSKVQAAHLQEATSLGKERTGEVKQLMERLKLAQNEYAALQAKFDNQSSTDETLRKRLSEEARERKVVEHNLAVGTAQLKYEKRLLNEGKAYSRQVEDEKKKEDTQLAEEVQKAHETKRQLDAERQSNMLLKQEWENEKKRELMLQKKYAQASVSLDAERENSTRVGEQLAWSSSAVNKLGQEVLVLRQKLQEAGISRERSQAAADHSAVMLSKVEAEAKQLQGSVPWLEQKVDAERRAAANATAEASLANEARDASQAMLAETKGKLAALEKQYAQAQSVMNKMTGKSFVDLEKSDFKNMTTTNLTISGDDTSSLALNSLLGDLTHNGAASTPGQNKGAGHTDNPVQTASLMNEEDITSLGDLFSEG